MTGSDSVPGGAAASLLESPGSGRGPATAGPRPRPVPTHARISPRPLLSACPTPAHWRGFRSPGPRRGEAPGNPPAEPSGGGTGSRPAPPRVTPPPPPPPRLGREPRAARRAPGRPGGCATGRQVSGAGRGPRGSQASCRPRGAASAPPGSGRGPGISGGKTSEGCRRVEAEAGRAARRSDPGRANNSLGRLRAPDPPPRGQGGGELGSDLAAASGQN